MDPIKLTRRLIDIESISGNEGAVGAELYEELCRLGYNAHKMPVAHERFNVVAMPEEGKPDVVFSTHMDTVPPFIPSSEDHDNIYGRGSCDAKGHHRRASRRLPAPAQRRHVRGHALSGG